MTFVNRKAATGSGSRLGRLIGRRRGRAAIVGVAALSLLLAGCSGGGSGDSGGHVTLTYGIWDQPQKAAMQQIIKAFEKKNPNIDVRIQLTPWDSYWTKLHTAASGGGAPDVFWMTTAFFPDYANGGVLMPLDDKIKKDGVDLDNYVDASTKSVTWDGTVYALPKDVDSIGLWYNKKLFADAGVPVPDGTWTGQDVIDAAKKLTDPAKGVYGIAAQLSDQQSYYTTIPQMGGHVISQNGKKSGYDSPEAIAAIQYWVDMIHKYKVSPTLQQMSDTDADTMFQSGKVAMVYEGSWAVAQWNQVPYAKKNAEVAPMPKLKQAGGVTNSVSNAISKKTKHPEEAWKFLKFLGSKKAAEIQAETGVVIPAYKGTAAEWVKANPEYDLQVFIDELKVASPMPASLHTSVWRDYATKEFTKAWTGQVPVPEAAKKVAKFMNKELASEASE